MSNFGREKLGGGVRMYSPPYGYDITEDGNIIPLEDDLNLLEEVAEMLEVKALSLRDAALYLTMKGSRSISHEGLRKRLYKPVRINEGVSD